jgi:hypothetical protein
MLYNVFLHLPQQDLLLIQRVCRVWREVITSSRVLQAALFLQPLPNAVAGEPVRMNPLLLSRFPAFFENNPTYHIHKPSTVHNMGPYYTTHWAKSIRPWGQFIRGEFQEECSLPLTSLDDESFREDEDPIVSLPESIVSIPEHLDPYLTAAYRQPEAS